MNEEIDNIVPLPPRAKKSKHAGVLKFAPRGTCPHHRTLVSAKLAKVTCQDCKEKLDPLAVLVMLTQEESRLRRVWAAYRAAIEFLKQKGRCKCEHCGKLTKIPSTATSLQRHEREYAIEEGGETPE